MARQRTVETFLITSIKDTQVPHETPGFPELPNVVKEVLNNCPVISDCTEHEDKNQIILNFDSSSNLGSQWGSSPYYLEQASPKHVRSTILKGGLADREWQDEYGNFYSCLTLKGNNFSHAELIETATVTDRYIGYGLQESAVIERILRASALLRQSGISTEYIVGLAEPKEFFLRHNGMPIQSDSATLREYKQYLVNQQWRSLQEQDRTFEAYEDIAKRLDRSTYYISMRACDTPYRFDDALNNQQARKHVFELVQELHGETLDVGSSVDWETYITKYFLPAAVGNMAKLHSLGLAHRYPNGMNITALGGIVDLDSVHGEALELGDEPIDMRDVARDIAMLGETSDRTVASMINKTMGMFATDVVQLYFEEVDLLYPAEDAINIKLLLMPHLDDAFAEAEARRYNYYYSDRPNLNLPEQLIRTVINPELLNDVTEQWLHESADAIHVSMEEEFLKKAAETANWLLFDKILHDSEIPMSKKDSNVVDIIFDPKVCIDSAAYEQVFRDLLLNIAVPSYKAYLEKHLKELVSKQYEDETRIEAIKQYLDEHLHEFSEHKDLVQDWVDAQTIKLFSDHKVTLNQLAQPTEVPYVFNDHDSCPAIVTSGNVVVRETYGLHLPEILAYAKENSIETTIQTLQPEDLSSDSLISGLDHHVADDAQLIQILAADLTDGGTPDFDSPTDPLRLTGYTPEVDSDDFLVYVEQKEDGDIRFVVALEDKVKRMALSELSTEELLLSLEQDPLGAITLFDANQYYDPTDDPAWFIRTN